MSSEKLKRKFVLENPVLPVEQLTKLRAWFEEHTKYAIMLYRLVQNKEGDRFYEVVAIFGTLIAKRLTTVETQICVVDHYNNLRYFPDENTFFKITENILNGFRDGTAEVIYIHKPPTQMYKLVKKLIG